jgi:hypothetical protein
MKKVLFILVMCLSVGASANECVDSEGQDIFRDPGVCIQMIQKAQSCYQASKIAEACAHGTSLDVRTAGEAYQVCAAELDGYKPNRVLKAQLLAMNKLCQKKFEKESGTMFRSMEAFCYLSAIRWIISIASPFESLA